MVIYSLGLGSQFKGDFDVIDTDYYLERHRVYAAVSDALSS
jgi:hypothetical protein